MKKILFGSLIISLCFHAKAQEQKYDSTAIAILDHMSNIIGDLSSCSFTLHTSNDMPDNDAGLATNFDVSDIFFSGPDKLLVNSRGEKGHRGYWYDGQQVFYYSYDENNYAVMDAPDNTIDAIDSINKNYGIDFPAADFFYPSFTDDLIDNCDAISFLGSTMINAEQCFHIAAKNKEMNIQFWITNDALFLPVKMVVVYNNKNNISRYEASFSDWQINPDLPSSMFQFIPPPNSNQVAILSEKSN